MATLTPEIAKDLMWRSMTTGAPTSEFDKYGGYDAVNALYASQGGGYGFDEMTPEFLDQVDDIIANTGIGNLSVLEKTGTPLTGTGLAYVQNALKAADLPDNFLLERGIPFSAAKPPTKSASSTLSATSGSSQPNQFETPSFSVSELDVPAPMTGNSGGFRTVGAADGSLMGAGKADYNSSLIKSLRQSSLTPFSTNTGVLMAPNQGASSSAMASSMDQMGGAFNPQVLNPRAASDQEVSDWNAYSTYRTNSLNAKTPILSMAEWLAGGKSDGKAPTNTTPTPDYYDYSAGA